MEKEKSVITIILPISRTEYLRPIFDCLNTLDRPPDTELILIIDGDKTLERAVDKRLDSISYRRIQIIKFGDTPEEDRNSRRYRISAIHNKARHYVPEECDYVFCIEDDTTYPPETLTKMLATLQASTTLAYVEGVELGRRNVPYVGGWKVDNLASPNEILSVMPSHGVQQIDAGGLYCCLVDTELYRMHQFEPYDKQGKNGLSCDLNFGLYLRQQGYSCLIDWGIQCDHIGDKGSVNLGNTKPRQVRFSKRHDGQWTAETVA